MYVFSKYYVEITHEKGKKIKVRGKTCEITLLVEVLYHLCLHVDVRSYQGASLGLPWGFLGASLGLPWGFLGASWGFLGASYYTFSRGSRSSQHRSTSPSNCEELLGPTSNLLVQSLCEGLR